MGFEMYVQGAPDYEEDTYLRRDCDDIVEVCRAMVRLAMAFASEVPEFPESSHLDGSDFRDGQAISERAKRYMQAREQTLADHGTSDGDHLPGIPTHKLFSKDGWHVTNNECTEAMAAYTAARQAGVEHPGTFADDLIPFLRTAARYEGFHVR